MSAPADLAFSHIGIHVHDLARMERFYVDELGFLVTDRGVLTRGERTMDLAFLSRDPDEHHQIALVSGRPLPLGYNVVNQISLRVESLAAIRAFHRRFRELALAEINPITHINAVSVYAQDPEANRIEIFWDTPWHVPQPLALPIDLEQDDAALMAWMEAKARSMNGFLPKDEWKRALARRMARG